MVGLHISQGKPFVRAWSKKSRCVNSVVMTLPLTPQSPYTTNDPTLPHRITTDTVHTSHTTERTQNMSIYLFAGTLSKKSRWVSVVVTWSSHTGSPNSSSTIPTMYIDKGVSCDVMVLGGLQEPRHPYRVLGIVVR